MTDSASCLVENLALACVQNRACSLVGCMSAWYSDGHGFDPPVRQHSFVETGHEIISMAILSLPLIPLGSCQLLVKGCALSTSTG